MSSQAALGEWSPEAIARDLNARAATNPLYQDARQPLPDGRFMAWRVSPEPYRLDPALAARMTALGTPLLRFYQAANKLYQESVKGRQPSWVHRLLDQGKPEHLVEFARMNRFKGQVPRVIRPDLLETEDGGLVAAELDAVPGGIGLTAQMAADYARYGLDVLGGADGLVEGFASMIRDAAGQGSPTLAIVVSEESNDYWGEQVYLGERLTAMGLKTYVLRPKALRFDDEEGVSTLDEETGERVRIDVVYRFFELFDLKNIPKAELLQYAAKKAQVVVTPPYKPYLEEKLLFALYQHPALAGFWRSELSEETREALDPLFPRTWVLDPTPLPPQAVYPDLTIGERAVTHFLQLAATTKKERAFVAKPSGFSPLAWGSHGLAFGVDLSNADWQKALEEAMAAYEKTPHLLQRYHKPARTTASHFHFGAGKLVEFEARARYCPYFFVVGDEARFAGMLVTLAPLDKLAIHGMTDAVMVPAGTAGRALSA